MNVGTLPIGPFFGSRDVARGAGESHYYSESPCKFNHRPVRTASEGKCDQCRRESWLKIRRKKGQREFVPNMARAEALNSKQPKFNGKDCPKGHGGVRWTYNGACVECGRLAALAHAKASGYKHARAWSQANKPAIAVVKRRYRASEKGVLANRKDHQVRRSRKHNAGGTHTVSDVSALLLAQGRKCAFCRCRMQGTAWHVDHITPLSRGGSNDKYNLQILCQPCNSKKWAIDPIEFAQRHGMLL